jgi:hypothetical protein
MNNRILAVVVATISIPACGEDGRDSGAECRTDVEPPTRIDVYMDAEQGFTRSVPLTILFDEAQDDTGGIWDPLSGTGTIKSTGRYDIAIRTLAYLPPGAELCRVALLIDGVEVVSVEASPVSRIMPQEITHRIILMSGSTVAAQFYFESADLVQAYLDRRGSHMLLRRVE